jgi:malonyl CoA-acyl carrier protein transacylase
VALLHLRRPVLLRGYNPLLQVALCENATRAAAVTGTTSAAERAALEGRRAAVEAEVEELRRSLKFSKATEKEVRARTDQEPSNKNTNINHVYAGATDCFTHLRVSLVLTTLRHHYWDSVLAHTGVKY